MGRPRRGVAIPYYTAMLSGGTIAFDRWKYAATAVFNTAAEGRTFVAVKIHFKIFFIACHPILRTIMCIATTSMFIPTNTRTPMYTRIATATATRTYTAVRRTIWRQ